MPGAPETVIQLIVIRGSAVVGGTVIERLIGRGERRPAYESPEAEDGATKSQHEAKARRAKSDPAATPIKPIARNSTHAAKRDSNHWHSFPHHEKPSSSLNRGNFSASRQATKMVREEFTLTAIHGLPPGRGTNCVVSSGIVISSRAAPVRSTEAGIVKRFGSEVSMCHARAATLGTWPLPRALTRCFQSANPSSIPRMPGWG